MNTTIRTIPWTNEKEVLETIEDDHICEMCGGDLREGNHYVRVGVDEYTCRPDGHYHDPYWWLPRGWR